MKNWWWQYSQSRTWSFYFSCNGFKGPLVLTILEMPKIKVHAAERLLQQVSKTQYSIFFYCAFICFMSSLKLFYLITIQISQVFMKIQWAALQSVVSVPDAMKGFRKYLCYRFMNCMSLSSLQSFGDYSEKNVVFFPQQGQSFSQILSL